MKRAEGGILEGLIVCGWNEFESIGGQVSGSGLRGEKIVPPGLMVLDVYAVSTVAGVNDEFGVSWRAGVR